MNRIETAALHHAGDTAALEATPSVAPVISCTPTVALAVGLGTLAGAALCAYIVSFEPETPDAVGDAPSSGMVVGDLVSRRRAGAASFV